MATYESCLQQTWHDPAWIPSLNHSNVMEYFSERSNPFYNRTCNNEIIKMQRLNPEQLPNMTGLEYVLIHIQEPILYIIRLQIRHSVNHVMPMAHYYIVAGTVYQAPDLSSVINSRMLNTVHSLESAFEEAQSFSRYHPSKGYWWEFKDQAQTEKLMNKEKKKRKEEPTSLFQKQRVDLLLVDFAQKFPPKQPSLPCPERKEELIKSEIKSVKTDLKQDTKTDKPPTERLINSQGQQVRNSSKPPPEKKPKLIR